jgi:hypothetical protein
MALGRLPGKRSLIGRMLGPAILRTILKKEEPLLRNTGTTAALRMRDTAAGDLPAQKARWIALLEEQAAAQDRDCMHPFFGRMTGGQTAILAYRHADHHLRQFGC